jgi:hypothetical protein
MASAALVILAHNSECSSLVSMRDEKGSSLDERIKYERQGLNCMGKQAYA